MKWNGWFKAATAAVILAAGAARADEVTPITTLSQANRLSIFHDFGIDATGRTYSDLPGSPGGGLATYLLGGYASTDTTGPTRPYSVSLTQIAGYDSNPEASRRAYGGAFGGADLYADYLVNVGDADRTVGSETAFYFSYDATGAVYSGHVDNADTFQQTLSGAARHNLFDDTILLRWKFDDQFTMEHGAAFLNTFETAPSAEFLVTRQTSAEIGYDFTNFQYYIPVIPIRNPDSNRSTFNSAFHFYTFPQQRGPVPDSEDMLTDILRSTLHRVTVGYDHDWNEASGRDYEYEGNRVFIAAEGLRFRSVPDLSMDVKYAHEWDQYDHPNTEGVIVLAGRPKARRRKDELDILALRANARLFDVQHGRGVVTSFFQWDIVQDHSNIFPRHFNEFVLSGGFDYRY